jgi:hypothetical protein
VEFADVRNPSESIVTTPLDPAEQWRQFPIANDLPRSGFHVKIVLDLIPGPHNDVAQVYINGGAGLVPTTLGGFDGFFAPVDKPTVAVNKAKAGQAIPLKFKIKTEVPTTWEDYYRYNDESNEGVPQADWTTRKVDSLIFQARGSFPGPADGFGYYIDNVTTSSTSALTLPTGAAGDVAAFGNKPFTAERYTCDLTDGTDPIEVYAPGASELKYDAATGIWHYNWKTYKDMAGMCVDMHLTLLPSANALFQIVK